MAAAQTPSKILLRVGFVVGSNTIDIPFAKSNTKVPNFRIGNGAAIDSITNGSHREVLKYVTFNGLKSKMRHHPIDPITVAIPNHWL
mmetsp:Transcript_24116/g.58276  ORF Transcript_24116/g.58276 Transcript_24116/m.58276 type:complete len:87 (+) Transcript_24116:114-374(+)